MRDPAAKPQLSFVIAAIVCAAAGWVLFEFFGNAAHGYVNTASMFWWWISQWIDPQTESQHGWLILGLSAWLFWRNLRNPRLAASSSNVSAVIALLVALLLHLVGFTAQQARISIVAFLLATWGVLRLGGGPRWGAAAMFPLAFMVFAIPINVLDSIGFWLRMWVVNASSAIAHAAGIGVLKSGTQLLAPDGKYNYDVAAACSGVRSLTAIAALSLLAGYLNFTSRWRRALVFLLCFPLVYFGNVARICAIIFAAQLGGPKWGDVAHEVMGYGVFVIVLAGVLGAIAALQRWWPEAAALSAEGRGARGEGGGGQRTEDGGREPQDGGQRSEVRGQESEVSGRKSVVSGATVVAAVVVALAMGEMVFLHHVAHAPPRGNVGVVLAADALNPVELPAFIGIEWTGERQQVTAVEREILPADTGFSRKLYFNHRDPSKRVFLSIVLSGRDRTSIHRPELCLVGQGWTIADRMEHAFTFPARPDSAFSASVLRVRREVPTPRGKILVPQLVAYWFVGGDAVVSTHWARFAHDAWNRLFHARADRWAYVLMQTDATDGEAAALARMQAVLDGTLPAFQKPLPSENRN